MSAEVVELGIVGNDITAGLRRLADAIDAGEYPDLQFIAAVVVDRDASYVAYSWGQCSTLEAIGALARAVRGDLVDDG